MTPILAQSRAISNISSSVKRGITQACVTTFDTQTPCRVSPLKSS